MGGEKRDDQGLYNKESEGVLLGKEGEKEADSTYYVKVRFFLVKILYGKEKCKKGKQEGQ
jgi:hypothetical protein